MESAATRVRLVIARSKSQWMLLLVWGVLFAMSFPRPNLWLLAHFALVPLITLAVRGETARRVAVNTFFAGWLVWLFMLKWLGPVTWPGTIAVSAYFSLYTVAFVLALRLIYRRLRMPLVLLAPILWVALEWIRGWLWTGFAWYFIGHSQPTLFIQIADTIGAYGVSFVVAMGSGALADLLLTPMIRRDAAGQRRWGTGVRLALPLWLVCIVATISYGVYQSIDTSELAETAPTLRVAVIQSNLPQSNKDDPEEGEDERFFAQMMAMSQQAAAADPPPQLIIWPETMVPRPINEESIALFDRLGLDHRKYLDELSQFVATHQTPLVVGAHAMVDWKPVETYFRPGYRFNSAYMITPAGISGRYDKVHRVPFGEYIPWVEDWPWAKQLLLSFTPYETDYTLSKGLEIVRLNLPVGEASWRLAAPICFEDVPSYLARDMVYTGGAKQVDLLVNLTNDGWFADTAQPWQHEQISRFRAVENRVPIARAVNTGPSSFIDSYGRIVERLEVGGEATNIEGVAVQTLWRDDRVTIFGRVGDLLAWMCVGISALLIALAIAVKLLVRKMAARAG